MAILHVIGRVWERVVNSCKGGVVSIFSGPLQSAAAAAYPGVW